MEFEKRMVTKTVVRVSLFENALIFKYQSKTKPDF